MSLTIEQALQQAITHHKAGRLAEAEHLYRAILKAHSKHPDANHNLGVLAGQVGQHAAALSYLGVAWADNPAHAQYSLSYAEALLANNRAKDALDVIQTAMQRGLDAAAAHALRDKAEVAVQAQAGRKPASFATALPEAKRKELDALLCGGRHHELERQARVLLDRYPKSGFVWNMLGISLQMQGKDGLAALIKAAELQPDNAAVHNNLGNALKKQDRFYDAAASYRRVLEIKPDFAEAHNNLGNVLQCMGQLDKAAASYRRALEIKPDYAGAHSNLGNVLRNMGQLDKAAASYRRAQDIQPQRVEHAIHANLLLPVILETVDSVAVWRERYRQGIAALWDAHGTLDDPGKNLNSISFHLAYHGDNNRSLMESLCRLFRERAPNLMVTAPHVANWHPPAMRAQRIRVGFLSSFLCRHTIGRLCQGYIHHLDRSRFEVVVIHTPETKRDSFTQRLDASADRVVTLPSGLKSQQQCVMAEQLDVLFYPDIGMTPSTYFLAYARLAPVQVVSWGHPDTTGLDSMDYFMSAASIEPIDAEHHYTEQLIRLNRLPCHYQRLMAPTQIPSRASLNLQEACTLYGCLQSLFKFHPDFDTVLARIAAGDPTGRIVLMEGKYPFMSDQLKARWEKSAPLLLERVLFLPRIPHEHFMVLLAHMDVLLDPIHFGSGNTLYEAMVYGTPIVTWPGQFMRARIVAGAYRQMGITDAPIASRLEDYADIALALGRDTERRQSLCLALRAAADRELFEDMRAVREFESFLDAAVAAAGRKEKLPVSFLQDS